MIVDLHTTALSLSGLALVLALALAWALARRALKLQRASLELRITELRAGLAEARSRREAERRSAEADRAEAAFSAKMASLGDMAAGVAHEINTPLAVISLKAGQALELLQDENPDRAQLAGMNQTILETVGRISRIVRGLHAFARDGSKDPVTQVLATELFNELQGICQERFKLLGIAFTATAQRGLKVPCRSAEILQLLLGLLNNARDAVQGRLEKRITLTVHEKGGFAEFTVEDSGLGVPSELRQKVFEPFFSTKEPGKGTGLGLSIARSIAESHGGSLELEPGLPTRFTLRLPLHHPESES